MRFEVSLRDPVPRLNGGPEETAMFEGHVAKPGAHPEGQLHGRRKQHVQAVHETPERVLVRVIIRQRLTYQLEIVYTLGRDGLEMFFNYAILYQKQSLAQLKET